MAHSFLQDDAYALDQNCHFLWWSKSLHLHRSTFSITVTATLEQLVGIYNDWVTFPDLQQINWWQLINAFLFSGMDRDLAARERLCHHSRGKQFLNVEESTLHALDENFVGFYFYLLIVASTHSNWATTHTMVLHNGRSVFSTCPTTTWFIFYVNLAS